MTKTRAESRDPSVIERTRSAAEAGLAVPRDDARAAAWYGRGAGRGDVRACVALARTLEEAGGPADTRRTGRIEALRRCELDGGYPPDAVRG